MHQTASQQPSKPLISKTKKPRAILIAALFLLTSCSGFGENPTGARLAKLRHTPLYGEEGFENPNGARSEFERGEFKELRKRRRANRGLTKPEEALEVWRSDGTDEGMSTEEGVTFTWYGHATVLVELDGFKVLTDPIWSARCSPFSWIGPERYVPPPIELEALPEVDAVIISHDHYDHLDEATVRALAERGATFYVPLGVGAHLERWGVTRFEELDWWQAAVVHDEDTGAQLRLQATPAQHFSGRGALKQDQTLWASWAILGPKHRVWFGGDTGYFEGVFEEMGKLLGPFDLTIVPIGAYDPLWPEIHLNPEEAVTTHRVMRGEAMLPIHWGTFNLAVHPWDEPIERALEEAKKHGVKLYMPRHGERLNTLDEASNETWWR